MQAAPRKAHKKTRSGCVPCKRRKVKVRERQISVMNSLKLTLTSVRRRRMSLQELLQEGVGLQLRTSQRRVFDTREQGSEHT